MVNLSPFLSDEDLHKIMDINKVFPKPQEVEEELKLKKIEEEKKAEKEELERIKNLAPPVQPPKMSQLIEAQIGGHSVDMPVSNPYLTDKIIDEEMTPMFDHQINDKRKCVNFKKYEKKAADITASKALEALKHEHEQPPEVNLSNDRKRMNREKPHQRKDWNCPWVKKDGSGLKQAVRYVEQPTTSAKTSHQHFYSEPRSILAPDKELTREELEALIREHGQESRPESRVSQGNSRPVSRAANNGVTGGQEEQEMVVSSEVRQEMMVTGRSEEHQEMMVTGRSEEHQRVSFAGETYSREW